VASNAPVEESWRSLFAAHFGDRMPVIGLMGPTELYAFGDTFGAVAQNLGACHVKIWPESPRVGFAKALRLMKQLEVEVIVCAPALCLSLAKAALHHGYDLKRDFNVKLFCVLGEISTPEFAADVLSVWGAPVYPTLYGSQEALAIATGCAEQRMHVSQPNYLVEIVEPGTDRVIGDTGTGELVLTMLTDGIKPLVRYRTGDLVSIRRNDCGCNRPGDVVEVHGRVADTLRLAGEQVHPAQLESAILAGVTGCLGYQVVIDADADGFDRVTVRLDLLPSGRDDQVREQVARRLGTEFGVPAEVEITDALDPVTTTGAFVSWKAARIADRRAEPDPEVLTALSVAGRYAHTT
jgi:phenylacetate-CoA ligase